jgi:hypothetical protein
VTAIGLLVGACVAFTAWKVWDIEALDAWMPNIVTSLVVAAGTISFIEWVRTRERRAHVYPQVEPRLREIAGQMHSLASMAAVDYAITHRDNYQHLPRQPSAIIALWRESLDERDEPRPHHHLAHLFGWSVAFGDDLTLFEADLRNELEDPAFGAAVRAFSQAARRCDAFATVSLRMEELGDHRPIEERREAERAWLMDFTEHAHKFALRFEELANRFSIEDAGALTAEEVKEIEGATA